MGTSTAYNEETGRFEVKDNKGNIVATGGTWREADFARQQVLFQNLPQGQIVRADVSEGSLSMTYNPYQQEQAALQQPKAESVPYSEYQKSVEMGKHITKAQTPPPGITQRSAYYSGRLEMSEPRFVPTEGYETTTYNVETGEKKVYPGVFTHDVSVVPVTEQETKELAFESELGNITTQEQKKAISSSIFAPVEARATRYVTGAYPPTGIIPLDVLGTGGRWAVQSGVMVGKSFELFTKPETIKALPKMAPFILPAALIMGKETAKFAVEQPGEFIGQSATFSLMTGALGKMFEGKPKVSSSVEAGEVFYEGGKGFVDSSIITDVGEQRFFTKAKTAFTIPEEPGKFSKGITLGKTTGAGLKSPEYTVTASLSKSLGKFEPKTTIEIPVTEKVIAGKGPIKTPVVQVKNMPRVMGVQAIGQTSTLNYPFGENLRFTKRAFAEWSRSGIWKENPIIIEKNFVNRIPRLRAILNKENPLDFKGGYYSKERILQHEMLHRRYPNRSEAAIIAQEKDLAIRKMMMEQFTFYEMKAGKPIRTVSWVKSSKGFDISMGMSKTVKVKMTPVGTKFSKPEPSAGMFLGKQYEKLLVRQGIMGKPVKDVGVSTGIVGFKSGFQKAGSIIRAKAPGKPKPIIKESSSPSLAMDFGDTPIGDQHIKMFAGQVEKSLSRKAKSRPSYTVGGLYSDSSMGIIELDELEFIISPKDLRTGKSARSSAQGILQHQGRDSLVGQMQIKDVMQGTRQRSSQSSLSRQLNLQDVFQGQRQRGATSQLIRQTTKQRQSMRIFNPPRIPTKTATAYPLFYPSVRSGKKVSKKKKKPYSMKTRYTPTLAAVVFGIEGAKPRQKFFSGVELRPMLRRKRKRNK